MKTTFQYDHYYAYSELTEALQTLVKNHPDLLAMESICKSEKDRDVWALTLTNKQTGDPLAKPAFYIDANTHAGVRWRRCIRSTSCAQTMARMPS